MTWYVYMAIKKLCNQQCLKTLAFNADFSVSILY